MNDFKQYVMDPGRAPLPSQDLLEALVRSHPWFMTARLVRAMATDERNAGRDPLLELHFSVSPASRAALFAPSREEPAVFAPPTEERTTYADEQFIDAFLAHGEYRISPPEGGDGDIAGDTVVPDMAALPGIVTEQLAQIYVDQRLWPQAKAAYEKLSLLYPKKSVYFAEIIARLEQQTDPQNT
jgi:hypothetical protein